MIQKIPFGNIYGFGNNRSIRRQGRRIIIIESYYSQGMRRSMFGIMPSYSVTKAKDSTDISGLGNTKYFARPGAFLFAQDDNGKIYQEATSGALDFGSAVRNPGGNGAGMIADQKGRLLYFNGASNDQLGKYESSTFTDNWQTGLSSWSHPADLYEDLVAFGNKSSVGVLFGDDSINTDGLTLPTNMTVDAIRSGHKGILIGANLGYRGALILWDGNSQRSLAPWLWTIGKVLSIQQYEGNWIVTTQKQIILTNGYTASVLFDFIDDPMGFMLWNVNADGTLVVNDKLIILQQKQTVTQTAEYGRMKAGVYVFDIPSKTFEYCPVSTGNTFSVVPGSIFLVNSYSRSIALGYQDTFLSKNYIGSLNLNNPANAMYVSERSAPDPPTRPRPP
jgi:hypothetical protein